MIETPTTKKIATNAAITRVVTEIEVVDVLFSEHVMEKPVEMLSSLFLK